MNYEFFIERRLLKIGNHLFTRRNKNLKSFDITTSQSEALLFFHQNSDSIVLDFAKHMMISHQAARNIVKRLKDKGLVKLEIDEKDARARKVYLTEKGKILHDDLVKLGSREGQQILSKFTDEEKNMLVEFLERINANL